MRRCLFSVAVIGSLLWAVGGVSVLAVVLHQHSHHSEAHGHHDALQALVHGHSHENSPDHNHELTATLSASRVSSIAHFDVVASEGDALSDSDTNAVQAAAITLSRARYQGPPPYLENCAFLT